MFMVSATTGDGVADLKRALAEAMPEGAVAFSRGPAVRRHRPHGRGRADPRAALPPAPRRAALCVAVETEKWEDRKDGSTVIHQQILVERDSQKAIVLGKGGSRLKAIGQAAREAIAEHLGRKVHLFLHVKVNPQAGTRTAALYSEIGLEWAE